MAAGGGTLEDIVAMVDGLPHHIPDLMNATLDRLGREHGTSPIGLVFGALLRVVHSPAGGCTEEELQVRVCLGGGVLAARFGVWGASSLG